MNTLKERLARLPSRLKLKRLFEFDDTDSLFSHSRHPKHRRFNSSTDLDLDLSVSGSSNCVDADMTGGSAIDDYFVASVPLHPFFFDDIRPSWHRKGTAATYDRDPHFPKTKTRYIPIKVEHVPSKMRERLRPNRDLKGDTYEQNPINIDWLEGSEPHSLSALSHADSDSVIIGEEKTDDRLDTLDLSDTPHVINKNVPNLKMQIPSPDQKDSHSKWTVIPVHYTGKKSSPTKPITAEARKSLVQEKAEKKSLKTSNEEQNRGSVVQFLKEDNALVPQYDENRQRIYIDVSSNDSRNEFDRDTNLKESDKNQQEKAINPAPSYPVYEELKKLLFEEDREIDYIKGDGNCFFRAISKQLYGTEEYHKAVRSLVIDIVATHKAQFSQFIDNEDIQAHVERMSEDNAWAETCEIYAAATLLQRDIYMLTPGHQNNQYTWLLFKPLFKQNHDQSSFQGVKTRSQTKQSSDNKENDKMSISKDVAIGNSDTLYKERCSGFSQLTDDPCCLTLCNTNGNHYDRVVPIHGGCNCFMPCPKLEGLSASIDLT